MGVPVWWWVQVVVQPCTSRMLGTQCFFLLLPSVPLLHLHADMNLVACVLSLNFLCLLLFVEWCTLEIRSGHFGKAPFSSAGQLRNWFEGVTKRQCMILEPECLALCLHAADIFKWPMAKSRQVCLNDLFTDLLLRCKGLRTPYMHLQALVLTAMTCESCVSLYMYCMHSADITQFRTRSNRASMAFRSTWHVLCNPN